ncbi:amino acid transporter [Microthyrium microscopicum]|uniref:Amino acid transporter n=1 Tax=Microthyrium microscopicum TaxID=703497 RepID=A0A6A6U732_9PEZI|nr:amino acid transporter [Microthyrium microscopicum]
MSDASITTPVNSPVAREDDHQIPKAQLSWRSALAILISIQIGSGIFSSPASVDSNAPSPIVALSIWILSGLLSWAGAGAFAELGTCLKRAGGIQEYLRYIYGDAAASCMAWVWIFAVKPSAMAIQGIVIGESIGYGLNDGRQGRFLSPWTMKGIALVVMNVIVLLNLRSTNASVKLSSAFTAMKLFAAASIAVGGIVVVLRHLAGHRDPDNSDWYTSSWVAPRVTMNNGHRVDWRTLQWWRHLEHYSSAIYAGLWAYSGWDNVSFIARDIRNPATEIPKAINAAMTIVMFCQLFVNVSYYILIPWKTIQSSNAVAVVAARSNLGPVAALIMASLVSVSCAGTIQGTIFSVGRLTMAAADDGYLPAICGRIGIPWRTSELPSISTSHTNDEHSPLLQSHHPEHVESTPDGSAGNEREQHWNTPIVAMFIQGLMTSIFIIIGNFSELLTFVGMSVWAFLFLAVLGLVILRYREPELERPYKVRYIAVPIVFVAASGVIVVGTDGVQGEVSRHLENMGR